ncbi:MAG: LysR family transcriptional regulator [Clostridia bacterium]|nr:LysR family transcriptional regulator [Clostridia bacterium]
MDDAQLRNFLLVAREGSLSRAASHAYISVPSLKAQMDRLEAELQVRLLARTNRGIELTQEGRLFLDFAKDAVNNSENIKKDLQNVARLKSETICIGYNSQHIRDFVYYEALARFRNNYPNTDVSFATSPSFNIQKDDLFLGVCEADGHRIIKRELGVFPLHCIVPVGCDLSIKRSINAADLTGRDVLIPPENMFCHIFPDFEEMLAKSGVRYLTNHLNSSQYIIQPATGKRISIIIGKEHMLPSTLVQIPLEGFHCRYNIYCSARAMQRFIVQAYVESLIQHYREVLTGVLHD